MRADRTLRVGTRASRLALWQTDHVTGRIQALWPDLIIERVPISTIGDRVIDVPLPRLGDKGVFTRELEDGLRGGDIDIAVHSLKDLPTEQPDGLALAAVLERADPRDALIAPLATSLADLPSGARVGTSSLRRRAQLLARRPDLDVRDLRGNVPTRLDKVTGGNFDAAVLAMAGLERLGLVAHVAEVLDPAVMLPAPGQGALAVQIRADDGYARDLLVPLDDRETRLATLAERAVLGHLEGGCQVPVGALASRGSDGAFLLDALVASLDGRTVIRQQARTATMRRDEEATTFGWALAERLLKDGAHAVLAEVRRTLPAVPAPGGRA